ncbi:lipoxygenase 1, chloroplastic [Tanacetum coccineum]
MRSFKITYQGKAYWVCAKEIPGWTPDFDEHNDEDSDSDDEQFKGVFKEDIGGVKRRECRSSDQLGNKSAADPFNIYSLLNKNKLKENKESNTNESLKYPPGFTPSEDVEANDQMDNQRMSFDCEKGNERNVSDEMNSNVSDSVGNSGGILCVWDPNSFKKLNTTISDYFVMIRGNWVNNGKLLLIISVYAPQEFSEKKLLWDYLGQVIAIGKRVALTSSAITLDRYLSDHRPILLRESAHDYGPISFRFFHYWLEVEGFENFVNEVWHEAPVVLTDFGDGYMTNTGGNFKRSKIKWAIEGDENSKYYHGILNKKRNQLAIRGVLMEGNWVESPSVVKNEFLSHFKKRFEKPQKVRPILNMVFPHQLNSTQKLDLEAEVSKEEIKKAVWDCGIDKSPGPDGFTFGFYRRFWDLIEQDVVSAVKCFFQAGQIPKGVNSSFIALIPKIPDAKMYEVKKKWSKQQLNRLRSLKAPFAYLGMIVGGRHEMKGFKAQGIDLFSCMHKKLGNGADTSFWDDVWRGDTTKRVEPKSDDGPDGLTLKGPTFKTPPGSVPAPSASVWWTDAYANASTTSLYGCPSSCSKSYLLQVASYIQSEPKGIQAHGDIFEIGLILACDKETRAPKKSKEAVLKDWSQKANLKSEKVNYTSDILVESDFGGNDILYPILAVQKIPYPRRCRTGRAPSDTDISAESRVEKSFPLYVPRDEQFEESKQNTFSTSRLKAVLHNLLPSMVASISKKHDIKGFSQIESLYSEGVLLKLGLQDDLIKELRLPNLVTRLHESSQGGGFLKDQFSWLRDDEFARQALAGVNPVTHPDANMAFDLRAMEDVTHPDANMAFDLRPTESQGQGLHVISTVQAQRPVIRTIRTLKPIAIELSLPWALPGSQPKRVLTPPVDATSNWTWQLAKAHVYSNDAGFHQLSHHWLRTHAAMEPFILSAHRQLSAMHSIYKLLDPHMRYTLEINAIARQNLLNADGVIEQGFTP